MQRRFDVVSGRPDQLVGIGDGKVAGRIYKGQEGASV
jgi:hypothetical protein